MRKIGLFFTLVLAFLVFKLASSQDAGTFITSDQNAWQDALWTEIATGACPTADCDLDGIPDGDDDVILQAGSDIEIAQNQSCNKLTIQDDGTFTHMLINDGTTLLVNNKCILEDTGDDSFISFDIEGILQINNLFDAQADNASFSFAVWEINISSTGILDLNSTSSNKFWIESTSSSGTITCDGTIDAEGSLWLWAKKGSTLEFNLNSTGSVTCAKDWIQYIYDANTTLTTNINGGLLDVEDEIKFGKNSAASQNNNLIDMSKSFIPEISCKRITSPTRGTIFNSSVFPSNFTFDVAFSFSLPNNPNIKFHNLIIKNSVSVELGANLSASQLLGDLDIRVGGSFSNSAGTFTLDVTDDILNAGTLTITGVTSANDLSNTSSLTQSAAINLSGNFANTGTSNAGGNLDIAGSFTNSGTYSSTGSNINIEGNWSNSGTYTYNTGDTVSFDGSTNSTISGTTNWNILNANNSGGILISNGNHNIYSALNIDQGTFNSNGNIVTLISNASGTAVLSDIGTGSYSGNLTVQRFVNEGPGWYLLASPLAGANIEDWNTESDMTGFTGTEIPIYSFKSVQYYDETVLDIQDSGYVTPGNTSDIILNGRGYWMYIADDNKGTMPKTLDVTSTPVIGQKILSLSFSSSGNSSDDGWHCIGNPYASTINWDNVTKSNINGSTCYALNTAGGYTTYSGSGGDLIASGEAVWVQVSAAGSLTFDENDKAGGSDPYNNKMQQGNEYKSQLKLLLTTNNYTDVAHIRFHDSATIAFEPKHDAYKLDDLYGNLTNISMLVDTTNVAVNTLPTNVSLTTIPIRTYRTYPVNGSDTCILEIKGGNELSNNNKCLFFEDILTGAYFKIQSDTSYTFTLADTTDAPRLFFHISTPVNITSFDATCFDENDGSIIATGNGSGPFDYIWEDANGGILKESYGIYGADTLINIGSGTYTLIVNTSSLCGNVSRTIEIFSLEEITLTTNTTNLDCNGDLDGEAAITINGGVPPFTYLWDINAGSQSASTATGLSAGTYSISVTDANSCINSEQVTLTEPPIMVAGFVPESDTAYLSNGGIIYFNNTSFGADSYLWDFGDGSSSTDISPWNLYTMAGNYTILLIAFDGNSCYDSSYRDIIILDSPVSLIEKNKLNNNLHISKDEFGAILSFQFSLSTPVTISVYNTLGQKVLPNKTESVRTKEIHIDLSKEPKGLYFFKINTPSESITKKIYF